MNTDKLRELALAATDGPWVCNKAGYCDEFPMAVSSDPRGEFDIADYITEPDAAYIAAANPTAILELLDALRVENRPQYCICNEHPWLTAISKRATFGCPECRAVKAEAALRELQNEKD